ncbi:DNA replication/repair protein RecF [Geomicrobium sp. JCM 19038]|uniref:DNA replication/repair protein RecF n=1 Tax=Geomicrobium sp. JCM 19038 TaxID=1460635 RepID=UPI00045F4D80|nr:DNA replication/repair protein RecF [Geomicrobium sp. JCM 19038]GAK06906.1 DNA recombination and repair protein RecF [Geomicrobium sp. JCM 19038]
MHVQKLSLNGYRNLEPLTLTFDNSVILFLGENAQGKTNLIESLYMLGFAKSHRTSKDRELIAWGEEHARIHGEIEKRTSSLTLDVQFAKQGSKRAKLNGLEQERISQYIGALNVVLFAPEDLNLVKGGPKERRRFIDMEIGQISNVYLHDLSQYYKTLKQRNQLLKDYWSKKDPIMLEVLTEQLIAAAAKVVSRRFVFLDKLQSWAAPIHEQISRGLEDLRLDYVSTAEVSQTSDLSTIEERYREAFHKKEEQEIRRGLSLVGPHREDFAIFVNEREIQVYGSQGQQRTAALSLKLAEIDLITEATADPPILLLDDVLSELDDFRQSHLLNAIQGKVQTFVTTTNVSGIEHETLNQAKRFYVNSGKVRTEP